MKILLLTLEYPPQKGGIASYYFGMVEELKKQGHEVEILSQGLLFKFIWPRWIKTYFILKKSIKVFQPDFVFVGQVLPLGTVAYLLRQKVPYVLFVHGMDILLPQKSWRKGKLIKKILKNAKIVVPNSNFTKELVGGLGNAIEPVYPCPLVQTKINPIEVDSLRRKLGLAGKKVLLTVGRVVERKGHDLVIKALPEILSRFPEVVYVVAGVGSELNNLNQLTVKLNLSNNVRFVGSISDEEKPLYYAICDLFVMPSRQIGSDVEGFGLVFLEAALFGKPSIGGRSGGVEEAILHGKTGLLINPEKPEELAKDVIQLFRDRDLSMELGENAKSMALYEFTWEKQVGKLLRVLGD